MRTDQHRPSQIDPAAYEHLFSFYYATTPWASYNVGLLAATRGGDPEYIEIQLLSDWPVLKTERVVRKNPFGKLSYFSKDGAGGCHICGARFAQGEVWRHKPTGECIVIGHICAEKYKFFADRAALDAHLAKTKRAKSAISKRRKRRAALREWVKANREVLPHLKTDHSITRDIRGKLIAHPEWDLTEAQRNLLAKLTRQVAERAAEEAQLQPVVEGKAVVIEGEVLSIRSEISPYRYNATILKVLVKDDRYFKVWGTLPDALYGVQPGDRVRFVAGVTRSDRDESFGFFKRPRKAESLSEIEEPVVDDTPRVYRQDGSELDPWESE